MVFATRNLSHSRHSEDFHRWKKKQKEQTPLQNEYYRCVRRSDHSPNNNVHSVVLMFYIITCVVPEKQSRFPKEDR